MTAPGGPPPRDPWQASGTPFGAPVPQPAPGQRPPPQQPPPHQPPPYGAPVGGGFGTPPGWGPGLPPPENAPPPAWRPAGTGAQQPPVFEVWPYPGDRLATGPGGPGGPTGPPKPPGAPGWAKVVLPLVLAVVVAVVGTTLYLLVFTDPGTSTASDSTTATTPATTPTSAAATTSESVAPTPSETTSAPPTTASATPEVSRALVGEWSGEGALTTCTGFSDACPTKLPVGATISCGDTVCTLKVGGEGFNPATLSVQDADQHRASGTLPFSAAPRCNGVPSFADWTLTFTPKGDKLVGTYSESSRGGFDCGPTSAQWSLTLTRG